MPTDSVTKRYRIKDAAEDRKPSLRISSIVFGRELRGTRVFYLVDPKGQGTVKKVAESVVLHRWRRRQFEGYVFGGCRLNPSVWRALPDVLGENVAVWRNMTNAEISEKINLWSASDKKGFAQVPSPEILAALIEVCGTTRLKAITKRHNDPERSERFGTPDLFLFARAVANGKVSLARFVEVKKPEEPLKVDQREEIAFLQSIGLHARVIRLDER